MKARLGILFVLILLTLTTSLAIFLISHHKATLRKEAALRARAEQEQRAHEIARREKQREEDAARNQLLAEEQRRRDAEAEQEQRQIAAAVEAERIRKLEAQLLKVPLLSSNNVVSLSCGTGEIVQLDSLGCILKRGTEYLPRIPWSSISDQDVLVMLKTPKTFSVLSGFGYKSTRGLPITAEGSEMEKQVCEVWSKGRSLKDRIVTRLTILRLCTDYSQAHAGYSAALARSKVYSGAAVQAQAKAEEAARPKAGEFFALSGDAQLDYLTGRVGGSPSDILRQLAVHQVMDRSPDYIKADSYSKLSQSSLSGASAEVRKMAFALFKLSELGVKVQLGTDWPPIMAMNLKREVVIELNSIEVPGGSLP